MNEEERKILGKSPVPIQKFDAIGLLMKHEKALHELGQLLSVLAKCMIDEGLIEMTESKLPNGQKVQNWRAKHGKKEETKITIQHKGENPHDL